MFLEVVREIAAALSDNSIGVAAQLLAMPVDVGNTAPVSPVVIDGTSDDFLAKGEQVARGASIAILVTPDGPTVTDAANIQGQQSNAQTPIACTVVHRGEASGPAEKIQDVDYVLRAIVLSLGAYFATGGPTGRGRDRSRNGVTLLRIDGVRYGLVQDDGMGAVGACVFTIHALDKRAQRRT